MKFKENKKGIIGTGLFHIGLLVLLIIFGFHTPLPLPAEEGILVNFGYEETGSGTVDPNPAPEEPVQQDVSAPTESTSVPVESNNVVEEVPTQNIEESAVIETHKPDKPKEKTPEELEQERIEAEKIQKQKEEDERKRIEAEKEAERLAEEERKRKEIEDRFKSSLGAGQNQDPNSSTGQGITEGESNQGVETGNPDSNNYGEGKGLGDEGISYDLKGRGKVALPKPVLQKDEYGTVVVEIRVNSGGNVISATPIAKGSTTTSYYLRTLAKEAAMKARFTAKPNSPDQIGTITYRFVLE